MENFESNIDIKRYEIKKTKAKLNDFQKEIMEENEPEIEAIKKAIGSLKSFEGLPVTINYPLSSKEKITQKKFPQKLDMWPKPFWDKRKNIEWKILNNADPLMICLDNRKFTVTPDIWSISKIDINQWKISLDVSKFGVKLTSQVYDPERMTKLLIILWTHKSGLNTDIAGTPWAIVKEVK